MISEIQAAFDAAVREVWKGDLAYEGVLYQAHNTKPYVAVRMAGQNTRPLGFGRHAYVAWSGAYQVSIFRPINGGKHDALRWAETIRAAFPRGRQLPEMDHGAIVENVTINPAITGAGFLMVPLSIYWFATETP